MRDPSIRAAGAPVSETVHTGAGGAQQRAQPGAAARPRRRGRRRTRRHQRQPVDIHNRIKLAVRYEATVLIAVINEVLPTNRSAACVHPTTVPSASTTAIAA